MKRLLLDSHALLWYEDEPERLSDRVRHLVQKPSTEVFVSTISIYELGRKLEKQRLPNAARILNELRAHLAMYGFTMLAYTEQHALRAARLPWDHRDPFDRMIAAQAIEENMILVTKDQAFDGLAGLKTIW